MSIFDEFERLLRRAKEAESLLKRITLYDLLVNLAGRAKYLAPQCTEPVAESYVGDEGRTIYLMVYGDAEVEGRIVRVRGRCGEFTIEMPSIVKTHKAEKKGNITVVKFSV